MSAEHPLPNTLAAYATRPRRVDAAAADGLEAHLLGCAVCRAVVARETDTADLDRSWAALARQLSMPDAPSVATSTDVEESYPAAASATSQARRRPGSAWVTAGLGIAACLAAGVVVWAAAARPDATAERSAPIAGPGWNPVALDDPRVFGPGLQYSPLIPWGDRLLMFGTENSGDGSVVHAFTSENGTAWTEVPTASVPAWSPWDGVAVLGDEIAIAAKVGQDESDVGADLAVFTSTDLTTWTEHRLGVRGQFFTVLTGTGPNGEVVVVALEAVDPNTTAGSRPRIWTSRDLVTWTEIPGIGDEFVDGQITDISVAGDALVLTGSITKMADPAKQSMLPAVWVSVAGESFTRTMLPIDPAYHRGIALRTVRTASGYAVVGGSGDAWRAEAWMSTDLVTWSRSTVELPDGSVPDARSGHQDSMTSVAVAPDGTLVAMGLSPGDSALITTFVSSDDGRTWRMQLPAPGPTWLTTWHGALMGLSSGTVPGVWTWAS